MFELSVALKYLIPRWRQLSVSIISLISILVIALVVWLILVFFSVTNGLEKIWVDKLISLTAPVRVTPTDAYYRSFYYLSDTISSESDYTAKSLGEKRKKGYSYNPEVDEEAPRHWALPDLDSQGNVKDIVALASEGIGAIPQVRASDYEITVGNLHINSLSQATYLGSYDPYNSSLPATMLPIGADDLTHLYALFTHGENQNGDLFLATPSMIKERLKRFFAHAKVKSLKVPERGWEIPKTLLPSKGEFFGKAEKNGIVIPLNPSKELTKYRFDNLDKPLFLESGAVLPVTQVAFDGVSHPDDVKYRIAFNLQGHRLEGLIPYRGLTIAEAEIASHFKTKPETNPLWAHTYLQPDGTKEFVILKEVKVGDGILLPKTFKESNVKLGDRGFLSYYTPTTSTVQEMRLPVYVAGFYDPGIIPIGGKYVLASQEITTLFRASHNQNDTFLSNGINIRFDNLERAEGIKDSLQKSFEASGISPYWKIETYREYDFTRDLIQQLHSEKNLFTLIATVIIIVACSNIISMLIILVNDKKLEIGILRSMGASSLSISAIFGLCGIFMGMLGSLIGAALAIFTLRNLHTLINWISWCQGYDLFNPVFYGDVLPNEMSGEALAFVLLATAIISLIAGIVPAVKASLLRPSTTLRAE